MAVFQLAQRIIEPLTSATHDSCPPAPSGAPATSASTMAEMTRGTRARVTGMGQEAEPATARRLFDLGFAPGVEVEMLRRAPMADPVVFRVAGCDIALRRAQARHIQVTTLT